MQPERLATNVPTASNMITLTAALDKHNRYEARTSLLTHGLFATKLESLLSFFGILCSSDDHGKESKVKARKGKGKERKGKERKGKERESKEWKGKEKQGKKGKERKGKGREGKGKGKERERKERKGKRRKGRERKGKEEKERKGKEREGNGRERKEGKEGKEGRKGFSRIQGSNCTSKPPRSESAKTSQVPPRTSTGCRSKLKPAKTPNPCYAHRQRTTCPHTTQYKSNAASVPRRMKRLCPRGLHNGGVKEQNQMQQKKWQEFLGTSERCKQASHSNPAPCLFAAMTHCQLASM